MKLCACTVLFDDIKEKDGKTKGKEIPIKGFGSIVINNIKIKEKCSFLDYIRDGCEVGMHVHIDFTQSNVESKNKQGNKVNLHEHGEENQYENVI